MRSRINLKGGVNLNRKERWRNNLFFWCCCLLLSAHLAGCATSSEMDSDEAIRSTNYFEDLADLDAWSMERSALEEQFYEVLEKSRKRANFEDFDGTDAEWNSQLESVTGEVLDMRGGLRDRLREIYKESSTSEVLGWMNFRMGQNSVNVACLLLNLPEPRGLSEKQTHQYQDLVIEVLAPIIEEGIESMEQAGQLNAGLWSELAIQWLDELRQFEENPIATCEATEEIWRYEGQVTTEARQTACDEGYEWACEWLDERKGTDQ